MHRHQWTRLAAAAWIAAVLIGSLNGAGSAFVRGACQKDADKLCPGLKGKELTPCLKAHQNELSTDCKVNLAEAREVVRQTKDACQPDIDKFCAGVKIGKGRIRRCLKEHEAELTTACKDQIAKFKNKYQSTGATDTPPPAASTEQK
jgi:hypothetical protein